MSDLTRFDPFAEMRALLDWPRRGDLFRRELPEPFGSLAVDVYDENGDLVVKTELAGLKKEDIKIEVTDGVLSISAETRADKDVQDKDYYLREHRYGRTSRSLRLPADVDAAKARAEYADGVLKVRMPHKKDATPRSMEVHVS